MTLQFTSVLDKGGNRSASINVNAALIATRKQAIALLNDFDPCVTKAQAVETLIEAFGYTNSEAERLYSEWLEDVA